MSQADRQMFCQGQWATVAGLLHAHPMCPSTLSQVIPTDEIREHDKVANHEIYRDNGKEMETTKVYWGSIGIMENDMETTIVHCAVVATSEFE